MNLICAAHPKLDAVARCVSCGHHLCDGCRQKIGVRNYCRSCSDKTRTPYLAKAKLAAVAAVAAAAPAAEGLRSRRKARSKAPARVRGTKSAFFAAMLSAIPGLGQFYAGRFFRGLLFGAGAVAVANAPIVTPLLACFLYVFNLFDAYRLAQVRNERLCSGEVADCRDDSLFTLAGLAVLGWTFFQLGGPAAASAETFATLATLGGAMWIAEETRKA